MNYETIVHTNSRWKGKSPDTCGEKLSVQNSESFQKRHERVPFTFNMLILFIDTKTHAYIICGISYCEWDVISDVIFSL